jgi:hypothetical protein
MDKKGQYFDVELAQFIRKDKREAAEKNCQEISYKFWDNLKPHMYGHPGKLRFTD